jgi:hypothetical protein
MNIVLATSPSEEDKHGVRSMAPLSLGYPAACVKKFPEVNVRIVDACGEGLTVNQAYDRVMALSPDLVGVSSTSFCFPSGIRLISRLKSARSDVVTVMGGYHPTMFDSQFLNDGPKLNLELRGEADESFPELCRRRRGLRQAFSRSWRNWRRIIDILDLLKFNLWARRAARLTLKDIKSLLGHGKSKPCG